jgi:2'-5' RNA ligase
VVDGIGRVFVAVSLPDEVRMALSDRLAQVTFPGRVTPPQNWHITFRFLGNIGAVVYERFLAGLDTSDLGDPFRVGLGSLGAFPGARKASVIWVGVSKGEERLRQLAEVCEEAAQTAGLSPNERPFHPHLSLSRVRPPQDARRLVDQVPALGLEWHCKSVVVYRSHLGRDGARYEPLETLSLAR